MWNKASNSHSEKLAETNRGFCSEWPNNKEPCLCESEKLAQRETRWNKSLILLRMTQQHQQTRGTRTRHHASTRGSGLLVMTLFSECRWISKRNLAASISTRNIKFSHEPMIDAKIKNDLAYQNNMYRLCSNLDCTKISSVAANISYIFENLANAGNSHSENLAKTKHLFCFAYYVQPNRTCGNSGVLLFLFFRMSIALRFCCIIIQTFFFRFFKFQFRNFSFETGIPRNLTLGTLIS